MPRRRRHDAPGRLHHVVGRGQDRQRIFWYRRDYRFFLALLVCATRRGRIRLHAYALMPNHFHLLVESVDGNLSATMQWVLGRYGGYFNATRDRTGHAFGGRFHSFPVTTTTYLRVVLGYIERNPPKADARVDPLAFEWSSARHHARGGPRPRWLARDRVDRFLQPRLHRGQDRESAYREVFRLTGPACSVDALVEARMAGCSRGVDALDELVSASVDDWDDWLARRARERRGGVAPLALVDPGSLRRACADVRAKAPDAALGVRRNPRRGPWGILETGLLRDLAGLTFVAIARHGDVGAARMRERHLAHAERIREDASYRRVAAHVARRALKIAFGEDDARGGGGPGRRPAPGGPVNSV